MKSARCKKKENLREVLELYQKLYVLGKKDSLAIST